MRIITSYPDDSKLFAAAAKCLADLSNSAVLEFGRCVIALPGGNTPRGLFRLLAKDPYRSALPWSKLHFYWGDERCVPRDHPESNYKLAYDAFLSSVAIPESNLHIVPVEGSLPSEVAQAYEQEIQRSFRLEPGEFPQFDLILLGMGADGHTASLFPGGPELDVQNRLVTWSQPDLSFTPRVTFTLETINQAKNVSFLVSGIAKAAALGRVLDGDESLPAALVKPREGKLMFFVDEEAVGSR